MLGPDFHPFIFFLFAPANIKSAYNEILGITNERRRRRRRRSHSLKGIIRSALPILSSFEVYVFQIEANVENSFSFFVKLAIQQ